MTYKYWPAVGNAHTYIHAAIELMRENPLKVEDIEMRARLRRRFRRAHEPAPLKERKAPQTMMDAKFSLPFTVALALVKGNMNISDFSTDALKDQQVLALADKVEPVFDAAFNWDLKLPAGKVEVIMRDGRRIERLGSEVPGTPERPMTWEELRQKFSECAEASIHPVPFENVKRVQDLIQDIETCDEIIEVLALVR